MAYEIKKSKDKIHEYTYRNDYGRTVIIRNPTENRKKLLLARDFHLISIQQK
jgi:hypothetical protein